MRVDQGKQHMETLERTGRPFMGCMGLTYDCLTSASLQSTKKKKTKTNKKKHCKLSTHEEQTEAQDFDLEYTFLHTHTSNFGTLTRLNIQTGDK